MNRRYFLGATLFASSLFTLPLSAQERPTVNQPVADFTLRSSSGDELKLADLQTDKKQALLVFFRGTW